MAVEWREKSFDFASDVTKQLIALATGVVTITITFSKDVLSLAAGAHRGVLGTGWVAFLISVIAGLFTLLALTGQLKKEDEGSIWAGGVRTLSAIQILSFLVGVAFALAYVIMALNDPVVVPEP
jgi:hypothetical protein